MTGCVYFMLNLRGKVIKGDPFGRFDFKSRVDPDNPQDYDASFFEIVYVDAFDLNWVNKEEEDYLNLPVKKWDHSALGDRKDITDCGACLRCDIRNRDFTNDEYVVIVISTHGVEENEPLIIMSDGHTLQLSDIVNALSDAECPTLVGKTRILVIQACRTHMDEPNAEKDTGLRLAGLRIGDGAAGSDYEQRPVPSRIVPVDPPKDFLIVYAAPSGRQAIRGQKRFSWMFREIASVVNTEVRNEKTEVNFLEVLTEANNRVSQLESKQAKVDEWGNTVRDANNKPVPDEQTFKNTMCIYHKLLRQPIFNLPVP